MRSISKAVWKLFLVALLVVGLEEAARLGYEKWDSQTVQSKMERGELKGTIDTIYCGTSLAYYAFSPETLDSELGTNSFNLATSGQPFIGTYYLIRDAVEENPVRQVYVTVSLPSLKGEAKTRQYISGFENMRTWKWKLRYLAAVQEEDVWISTLLYTTQIEDFLDFNGVSVNLEKKLVSRERAPDYAGRGYRLREKEFKGKESKKNGRKNYWNAESGERQIEEEELRYLEKIARFCTSRGIRLTLVVLPYPQVYLDGAGNLDDFHEFLKEKAQEWGVEYLNFILHKEREDVFTNDKFKDDHHMNAKGFEAFCRLFVQAVQSSQPQNYFHESMEGFSGKAKGDL